MDDTIIQSIINSQNSKVNVMLATIIRTEGSTPRGPGTQMLVIDTGQTIGTIGGGTAEKLIFQKALTLLTTDREIQAEVHRMTINHETGSDKLSVCGANMDVLLESVQDQHFWQFAHDLQLSGKDAVIITSLYPPYSKYILDTNGNLLFGQSQPGLLLSAKKLQKICASKLTEVVKTIDENQWLVEPILKTERLLILGAGHVAREVAFFAKSLDFQVTVIDNRAAFALPEYFSGAYSVICSDFAAGINDYKPDLNTYVVIATWSHQTDAECLNIILNFPTKYVGMLGSTKKISTILKYLEQNGYTSQDLTRLRAPIGLDIKAQTPSEIAVSILAEIISIKRSF